MIARAIIGCDYGSVSGIRKRMFCQSSGMDHGRLFPDSGVLSCDPKAETEKGTGCSKYVDFVKKC